VQSLSINTMSWIHNRRSPFKIPFYLVPPIVFSFRAHAFFYLGTIRRFSWNSTTVSHCRFRNNRRMNTSTDVSKFKMSPFFVFKCWILLKPVLGGVDGNFPVQAQSHRACNIFNIVMFILAAFPCWSCLSYFRLSLGILYSLFWSKWFTYSWLPST
jgi:hypothetical protein